MGIKQLYNDNLQKLPNEYGDVSVMAICHLRICWKYMYVKNVIVFNFGHFRKTQDI